MGLKVNLKDNERIIVNGAVLRASGRVAIEIENRAVILRGSEFMPAEDATTPARQLYHSTMMAYVDEEQRPGHQDQIIARVREIIGEAPSIETAALCASFAHKVACSDYYNALSDCRELITLEDAQAASV
jgi:flagellar protein FlbT